MKKYSSTISRIAPIDVYFLSAAIFASLFIHYLLYFNQKSKLFSMPSSNQTLIILEWLAKRLY